ncbi:phosphoglycerate dehydrogenase [Chitinophagaceae bacterium MMS25-I14]
MKTSYPREKLKVLLLENVNEEAVNIFKQHGYINVTHQKAALSEEELIEAVKDVHVLGIRSKTQVTADVLNAAPKLLAIGCFCIGTNQVDLASATAHGVAVFNAPYSNTRSVAELVIGAAIMLIRRIPDKNRLAHEGIWMKDASNSYELRGKTLGIIGYGNIGSQVSVLAEAMGMKILFYDNQKKLPLGNARAAVSLEDLLQTADIITLHTPATAATQHMINRETLSFCKHGAILINYARGEVLDIAALKDAIDDGTISGAAVDVFPDEPEKNGAAFSSVLQLKPNVLLTPHIGGSTEEAQANIGLDVSSKLVDYIESGASNGSHTVPPLNLPVQEGTHRILHIHKNVPGVLSAINTQLSAHGINILGQYLKTNDTIGYVVLDVNTELSGDAVALLKGIKETIRVRVLY